jgi:hypothetical protein
MIVMPAYLISYPITPNNTRFRKPVRSLVGAIECNWVSNWVLARQICESALNVDQGAASNRDQLLTAQGLDPTRKAAISAWSWLDAASVQTMVNLRCLFTAASASISIHRLA